MQRMDRIFLWAAGIVGLVYVVIIPPFQAPDEAHHYYRVHHIASGNFMAESTVDSRLGGDLPRHHQLFAKTFRKLRYQQNEQISWEELRESFDIPHSDSLTFYDFPNVGYYSPFSYIPFVVARILPASEGVFGFYMMRVFGLLFWLFCLILCIQIYPQAKSYWLILGTIPSALFLHCGITADTLNHGLAFILIAMSLRWSRNPSNRDWFWIIALTVLLTYNKVVLGLIGLLPLILLMSQKPILKIWIRAALLPILILIAVIGVYYLQGDLFIPYDQYHPDFREDKQLNPGVSPNDQLRYMLANPGAYVQTVWLSWKESIPYTWAHYLGKFGWEANYFPIWTYVLMTFFMVYQGVRISIPWTAAQRLLLIIWVGLACTGISSVLYMQWHAPGDSRILSLSGRYFIGIFPILFLSLAQGRVRWNLNHLNYYVWIGLWLLGIWLALNRYWII